MSMLIPVALLWLTTSTSAFGSTSASASTSTSTLAWARMPSSRAFRATRTPLQHAYVPMDEDMRSVPKFQLPLPKIGDAVRFFDVDGGRSDGQVLVGKISFIQPIYESNENNDDNKNNNDDDNENNNENNDNLENFKNRWLVEINKLEDVGDGYYAEYPSRKRRRNNNVALRKLEDVAPLPASYVRAEEAFKVPCERGTGIPIPSHVSYDLRRYEGPAAVELDKNVLATDAENYNDIKSGLLTNAAIAGAAGSALAGLLKGPELAAIYAAGAAAGVAYLYFLTVKTDTLGTNSKEAKLAKNISNLRFILLPLILLAVAIKNRVSGLELDFDDISIFTTVSPPQFAAATIGFLTYRVPLFASQLFPVIGETAADLLPGSAGVVARMAQDAQKQANVTADDTLFNDNLIPVLLVSGPEATGKTTLVNKLMEADNRFVSPDLIDRLVKGETFERMERRGELLQLSTNGRYGLTKEGILNAAKTAMTNDQAIEAQAIEDTQNLKNKKVVVIDASVDLAKQIVSSLSGARIVGVWVGLDSLDKFKARIKSKLIETNANHNNNSAQTQEEQAKPDLLGEEALRGKARRVVKDIEYGVVSGVFEFTILNEDVDESLQQLREAAEYCFK